MKGKKNYKTSEKTRENARNRYHERMKNPIFKKRQRQLSKQNTLKILYKKSKWKGGLKMETYDKPILFKW